VDVKFADLEKVLIAAWHGLFPNFDRFGHNRTLPEMASMIEILRESKTADLRKRDPSIRDSCDAWLTLYKSCSAKESLTSS